MLAQPKDLLPPQRGVTVEVSFDGQLKASKDLLVLEDVARSTRLSQLRWAACLRGGVRSYGVEVELQGELLYDALLEQSLMDILGDDDGGTVQSVRILLRPPAPNRPVLDPLPSSAPFRPPSKMARTEKDLVVSPFSGNDNNVHHDHVNKSPAVGANAFEHDGDSEGKFSEEGWSCGVCTFENPSGQLCQMCSSPRGGVAASSVPASPQSFESWICQACTYENQKAASECSICLTAKGKGLN